MNDLMSLGIHRLWKRIAIQLGHVRAGEQVLDLAGGTGDMTALFQKGWGQPGRWCCGYQCRNVATRP